MAINLADFGIDRLNMDERMELALAIWQSVADEVERELPQALQAEIAKRIEDHKRNPTDAIPWEQTRAEAYASLKK